MHGKLQQSDETCSVFPFRMPSHIRTPSPKRRTPRYAPGTPVARRRGSTHGDCGHDHDRNMICFYQHVTATVCATMYDNVNRCCAGDFSPAIACHLRATLATPRYWEGGATSHARGPLRRHDAPTGHKAVPGPVQAEYGTSYQVTRTSMTSFSPWGLSRATTLPTHQASTHGLKPQKHRDRQDDGARDGKRKLC